MSEARDAILARIKAAVGELHDAHPMTPPPPPGPQDEGVPADLLTARLKEYGVEVARCGEADLPALIQSRLEARGSSRVAVPPGLPEAWRPAGAIVDDGLSAAMLDGLHAAITGCTVAAAANGAIMLNAAADQGRRALTLLVDHHLCIVREEQIVTTVADAMQRLLPHPGHHAPVTIFAGPSATSDIELNRVAGVHGPRKLDVLIVS
ncbi:LutC/YkgG family protein [Arboricoccus pini]|uniref:LutC/YkgG family protein n=1 Tax=Arboricoccus pini TaxID=1963835 RepID=UPI001A9C9EE8|nr:LUD domain-containing protein [Arboricoccus pini]